MLLRIITHGEKLLYTFKLFYNVHSSVFLMEHLNTVKLVEYE